MSGDPYRDGQELTRVLREELQAVREDVNAIVRHEVARSGLDPARVHTLVREAVARELDARTPWAVARLNWIGPVAVVALGLSLGLSTFALLAVREARTAALEAAAAAATEAPAAPAPPVPVLVDPEVLAARYDSLLATGAPELEPLVAHVEAATADPRVRTAVAAWRLGQLSPELGDRLHAALVQSVLRTEIDSTLVVDGGILREPCRGASCDALLRLWRERGQEFGLPAYSHTVTTDAAAVRTAERLIVMSRLEGGAG